MPSCCAPNCTNSSKKGSRCFRFPRDKIRRNIWVENCKRENWAPTSCSALCEGHFEEAQFELHRLDGWKKLRPNAIPTIFNVRNPPKKIFKLHVSPKENPDRVENISGKIQKNRLETEHSYISKSKVDFEVTIKNQNELSTIETQECTGLASNDLISNHQTCELRIKQLKSRNREIQRQNQKLMNELKYLKENLKHFLTDDQITHLKYNNKQLNGRKGCKIPWNEETLCSSRRLFSALGKRGYQYLRDTGYPMPSRRTLFRHRMEKDKSRDILSSVEDNKSSDDIENRCVTTNVAELHFVIEQNIEKIAESCKNNNYCIMYLLGGHFQI